MLSNLTVKSNVLTRGYQTDLALLSVFELKDIGRRAPLLGISLDPSHPHKVTPAQLFQWTQHLFWGERAISMDDDDRWSKWIEVLAQNLGAQVGQLEAHPNEELAFELLYVADKLAHCDSRAAAACRSIRGILRRDEFGYSDEEIQSRLVEITG